MKISKYILIGAGLLVMSSCDREYLNPGAASEEQVVTSQSGLLAMVNGLQYRFTTTRAGAIYSAISADGLTTGQLTVLNAGNTSEVLMETGGPSLINDNSILNGLWNSCHLTKSNADIIIANIDNAPDPAVKSGILAAAHMYRAIALGTLATFWEKAPITVGQNASFNTRQELLAEAIKSLDAAAATLAATPPGPGFNSGFIGGLNLASTVQALLARYHNMLGNNDAAIAAASKASLTTKNVYLFDDVNPNPMFFNTFGNRNVTEPTANFGLKESLIPASTDGRRAFYYSSGGSVNLGNASFFTSNTAGIPVYLPGEMILIKAEAYARKGSLNDAIAELNKVLTKSDDVYGINAKGEPYSGEQTATAVLNEIYRQRSIELFLMGQRLEDNRRFGRPASERNRDWYPYPRSERTNNTSTPADPTN